MRLETEEQCHTTITSHSAVMACLEAIGKEQQAARNGLSGYAVTARHDFINARMDSMGTHVDELVQLVGDEETAWSLVLKRLNQMPEATDAQT